MRAKISQLTRRDIIDAVSLEKIHWWGRLEETLFLSRLYDLKSMPSTDNRYQNAEGDIRQHRLNNYDWEDNWVFFDDRFGLNRGEDDVFLRFLCETINPVVRSDANEVEKILNLYNLYLKNDGYEIVEKSHISGKPLFIGMYIGNFSTPGINSVKEKINTIDSRYVSQQLTRMETAVQNDPDLAIGTAKELIETCCKTILENRNIDYSACRDLSHLVKLTSKELALTPSDIPESAKANDIIKRLLSNLASITNGIAELRNQYGTGHGKNAASKGLTSRHAKLAVGAASTLAVFLFETYEVRDKN